MTWIIAATRVADFLIPPGIAKKACYSTFNRVRLLLNNNNNKFH